MQFCFSQLKKALAELGSIRERQQRAKDTGFPDAESPEIEDIKSTATNPGSLPPFPSAAVLCQMQHTSGEGTWI